MSAWILLAIAIIFEVIATSLLKASHGFTRPLYGVASIGLYSVCFWLLGFAFTKIPMGVAYAIWSGVGITLIALVGVVLFRQSLSLIQICCIALIAVGAIGLNLATPTAEPQRVGTGSSPE